MLELVEWLAGPRLTVGAVALCVLGGVVVGVWAAWRIPEGIEATAWRRLARRVRRLRRRAMCRQ